MAIHKELECELRKINFQIFKYGRSVLGEYDISGSQFNIIATIYFNGPMGLKKLCEYMSLAPSTISEMIKRMIKTGLVKKEQDKVDKRKIVVNITDKSIEIVKSVINYRIDYVKRLVEPLSDEEKINLLETLKKMENVSNNE